MWGTLHHAIPQYITPPLTPLTQEYKDIFEPLLLEECCAQILRGMEEGEVLSPHRAVVGAAEMVRNQAAVGPFATPEV